MAKAFSTSKFESMSSRPPTPPKDLHDEDQDADIALQFLEDPFGTKTHASKAVVKQSLLSTPEQSPSSEIGILSSAGSSRKRVSFIQACTAAGKGLSPAQYTPRHSSPLRPLPQTRVLKPLKSILKACDPASTPPQADQSAAAHDYTSFADMLESIVKLLAQPARASRLDAYINLTKTMQAYERVPDVAALVSKMGLLSQFIQRDMQAISIGGTGPDSQLISQALRMLMALVRVPELKTHMDDAFCSFVIDRIILVTADSDMPKTIINTHLALLMQQNFRPKIMTLVRVEKILDVLDNIPERVSGNSVHAYRLRVFRKLVQQRGDVMIKHTERWFKPTVAAMLSPQKDINQSALDMAISATKLIGSDHHVTKSVLAVLNREKSDGNTVGKVVVQQLEKMLGTDSASIVPQVWAAVTALLSDSLHGTAFTALREWLTLLQKIISSQHEVVRIHANVAFCFLVYALKISSSTPQNWSKILRDIPQHQLQRRNQPKKAELDAATSGYFTLLYYSFQPAASHAQLDRYWEEFVADFWRPFLQSPSPKHAVAACRIVSALLRGSRRPWDEQRALDFKSQVMIQREELPLLEPKWVRKALSTILEFVETLLDTTPWTPDVGEDESVKTMWIALLDSLVEASSKEIMASTETKDAIAHIVNLLRRMWDKHTAQLAMAQQTEDTWAERFCFLVDTVVQKLGAFQFADKCLTRNAQDEFEVAPTPSHRSRQHGPRISPLLYFVELLVSQSEGKLSDPLRLRVVELVLEPCLKVQNTRLGKLDLLRDCSRVVDPASKTVVAFDFWSRIATLTKSCIEEQPSDSNERVSRQLGKEYEVVVDILALGSPYLLDTPRGQEVLSTFIDSVRREAGDGAVVLSVIEQVSKRVLQRVASAGEDSRACLPYASTLLRSLPPTISRRVLDLAKQNLSPSTPTLARNAEFEPYKEFYTALVLAGLSTYRDMDSNDVESTRNFLAALANSIQHCPISLLAVYLRKIQEFVSFWIADADKKLQKKDQQIKDLHSEVLILWQTISDAIERLPKKDSQLLTTLEPLLTAGFVSRRRGIVNISIKSWNATFGKESSLRYPSRLEIALQRLRNTVELSVPSLPAAADFKDTQITFYESDTGVVEPVKKMRTPRVKESPFRISKATRKSRSPVVKTLPPAISSTPAGSRRVSSRLTPKVRLRHDNSQIQFEPITSSPTNPFVQESQILTERQKEMIERQRINANIFSDLRSTPRRDSTASIPPQSHLDATGADDLPMMDTRTPIRSRASLGPMDVHVGSSPTPHPRRSQQIVRDNSDVVTPNAVRTVRLDNENEELGSSPPRFERDLVLSGQDIADNDSTKDIVSDSFNYRQPSGSYSMSFDDGTTLDEDLLPNSQLMEHQEEEEEGSEDELPTDIATTDLPSSTVELQLTAQLDAELNMQDDISANQLKDPYHESNSVYVDAASYPLQPNATAADDGNDTEVEETQPEPVIAGNKKSRARSSSTSRIGDSFSSQVSIDEPHDSQVQNVRRSSRVASSSPHSRASAKKRRQLSMDLARKAKKTRKEVSNPPSPFKAVNSEEGAEGTIVTEPPQTRNYSPFKAGYKRRSTGPPQSTSNNVIVPDTTRKSSMVRTTSQLSQVENVSEDVLVEDTPAPKRARGRASRDVSEAKTPTGGPGSHVKRLSHVQVTPKSSSSLTELASSSAVRRITEVKEEAEVLAVEPTPTQEDEPMHEGTFEDSVTLDLDAVPDAIVTVEQMNAGAEASPQLPRDTAASLATSQAQSQPEAAAAITPRRPTPARNILTPRGLINRLKDVKDYFFGGRKDMVLDTSEEKELDDVLFDLRVNIHEAGSRGRGRGHGQ